MWMSFRPDPWRIGLLRPRTNVGVIWFTVRVEGKPSHVREMSKGFNAFDATNDVIADLRTLDPGQAWEEIQEHVRHASIARRGQDSRLPHLERTGFFTAG